MLLQTNTNVSTPPNLHIEWIGYARVLTMLLVVLGHCTYYTLETDYGGIYYHDSNIGVCLANRIFRFLVSSIYVFHMSMFAMISGMCFNWTLKKQLSFHGLITNKFYRLLIPFLFTAVFLSIPIKYITGYWSDSDNVIRDIILGQLLLGGNSHLWFLMSLFNVFMFSYLIGHSSIKKDKLYFATLFGISVVSYKLANYNWLGLAGAGQLMFFFEIGRYYFNRINKASVCKWQYILLHVIAFCALCKTLFTIHLTHGGSVLFIPRIALAVYGCYILIMFSKLLSSIHIGSKIVKIMDKDSFGMYLFSDPFNYAILALACPILRNTIFTDNGTYTMMFFARFFITLFISVLLTRLVRNLKI